MTIDDIRDFVSVLPEPAVVITAAGRIVAANDAYRTLLRDEEESEGADRLHDAVIDDPADVEAFLKACAKTRPAIQGTLSLRTGKREDKYRCEAGVLHADTDETLLLLRFQRAQEAVKRFTLLSKKIEELNSEILRRRLAETKLRETQKTLERRVEERTADLKRANEELLRSNRSLEEFAYVASHDLREPLRKITLFSEMLQQESSEDLTEAQASILDRMFAAASRMDALIRGLLEYSRISTKGRPFTRVDLNVVVKAVIDDLEVAVSHSGAEIDRGSLPVVQADEVQMRQLFQNLISNSLKFRREDVRPQIDISAETHDEEGIHRIEVADNGIGFEAEFAETIFDPFERLHGRDEFEGTGIGLAVCKKIVERHGGRIRAETPSGPGARFIIQLPSSRPVSPEDASA